MEKKKNSSNKTVAELKNEIEANEKVIEKALREFKGHSVTINTCMYSSVNSMICFEKLDWTYLVGSNEQVYFFITEAPFAYKIGTSLTFDVDNVDEIEYNNNILKIWFEDGFRLYMGIN